MCLAIPGKIETISGDDQITRMGRINFGGIIKEASLAYVPGADVGDYVIVHAGFALSKVDEEEAHKVFGYLQQMEELGELSESPPVVARASRPSESTTSEPSQSKLTGEKPGPL